MMKKGGRVMQIEERVGCGVENEVRWGAQNAGGGVCREGV
jgi:hypothetical protein